MFIPQDSASRRCRRSASHCLAAEHEGRGVQRRIQGAKVGDHHEGAASGERGIDAGVMCFPSVAYPHLCPLEPLQVQLPAFQSFNDYAGAYHHDTFDAQPLQDVNDGELEIFGRRALDFVHYERI